MACVWAAIGGAAKSIDAQNRATAARKIRGNAVNANDDSQRACFWEMRYRTNWDCEVIDVRMGTFSPATRLCPGRPSGV